MTYGMSSMVGWVMRLAILSRRGFGKVNLVEERRIGPLRVLNV